MQMETALPWVVNCWNSAIFVLFITQLLRRSREEISCQIYPNALVLLLVLSSLCHGKSSRILWLLMQGAAHKKKILMILRSCQLTAGAIQKNLVVSFVWHVFETLVAGSEVAGNGAVPSTDGKLYHLDDTVKVWSDFICPHLHPRSLHVINSYLYDA
jgi:hypothetical protein